MLYKTTQNQMYEFIYSYDICHGGVKISTINVAKACLISQ